MRQRGFIACARRKATQAAALDLKLTEKDELRVYTPSANVSCSVFGRGNY